MPLWHDLRYGFRRLVSEPRFALVAIVTLAVAIGASSTLFSVIDAALLRAVPYPHPDQLAVVLIEETPGHLVGPALKEVRAWQTALPQVQQTCVWRGWSPEVIDTGEFDRARVRRWSEGCLDLYGLKPALGRGFTADDTRIGAPLVAMLGYRYWQQRYGAARDVLGKTIRVADGPATIVGVVPAGQDRTTAVFVPLRSTIAADEEKRGRGTDTLLRLRAGVTLQAAGTAITGLLHDDAKASRARARVTSLYDDTTRGFGTTIRTLACAVGLILLLACMNVGGLLLARGRSRQTEIAIRASLGARTGQVVTHVLRDACWPLVCGTVAGSLGAAAATRVIAAFLFDTTPTDIGTFMAVAIALTLSGTLAAWLPARSAARVDPSLALRSE